MNPTMGGSQALRDYIIADPTLSVMLTTGSIVKVFRSAAPATVDPPYVRINHIYGGEEWDAPRKSMDMMFRVEAISLDQGTSEMLANLLYDLLNGASLTLPDGWKPYARLTSQNVFTNTLIIKNETHYADGAFWRLRATKG